MSLLTSILPSWLTRAAPAGEGQYREGPYFLSSGWLPAGSPWNYWQSGGNVQPYTETSAMVEACVGAYSQTIAMCPADHWRSLPNGGRERVTTSAASRMLRRPNDYQSASDFWLNATRSLYLCGNAYAVAIRNDRFEIAELHLMRKGEPQIATTGEIFYSLSGNQVLEQRIDFSTPVPARDVLHIRLHTPMHPLKGVSPILAAALDLAMSGAALNQQIRFYLEGARPSFILSTPENWSAEQLTAYRARWVEQTSGANAGGSPILTRGVTAQPVSVPAGDANLAELLRMNAENVALAYRVPLPILGLGSNTYSSTELLMGSWVAGALGFGLNHIEVACDGLFGLRPGEYVEFDTRVLLRSAYKDQITALQQGVLGGIYSPDEARAVIELPRVPGGHGDMPRVQQQLVPLSYGSDMKPPPVNPPAPPPAPANDTPDDPLDNAADAERALAAYRAARAA